CIPILLDCRWCLHHISTRTNRSEHWESSDRHGWNTAKWCRWSITSQKWSAAFSAEKTSFRKAFMMDENDKIEDQRVENGAISGNGNDGEEYQLKIEV